MREAADDGRGSASAATSGPIYLDHNATTPLDPRVLDRMVQVWRDCGANPASQHAAGRGARRIVEESREDIIELLGGRVQGMQSDHLIFTSGGTEANHLALCGLRDPKAVTNRLAISAIEHPSVSATAAHLQNAGWQVETLPVLASGVLDLAAAARLMVDEENRPHLLSVMLASNETGILQPVVEVCQLAVERGSIVHTDAAQAVGKIPVHFRDLGVAAMTVAPHKFHGPIGIGGLLLRHDVPLEPQMRGGFQQGGLRPGTESAALVAGFQESLRLAQQELRQRKERMHRLRDEFVSLLKQHLSTIVVIGENVLRIPHTACISFPGLNRQALVMTLDLAGVACSTGSACASGSSEPSQALVAMGLPAAVVEGAIRFSLGAFTTGAEIDLAAKRIIKTVKHLQSADIR